MAKALIVLGCLTVAIGLNLVRRPRKRQQKNITERTWRASSARTVKSQVPKSSTWIALHEHAVAVVMGVLCLATLMMWLGGRHLSEGEIQRYSSFLLPFSALCFSVFLIQLVSTFFAVHSFRNGGSFASATNTENALSQTNNIPDFGGLWMKNGERSSSADGVMKLMHIGPLLRTAVHLVRGLEIQQDTTFFHLSVISIVRFLKVTEKYALNGERSDWKRRDLRRGRHTGYVQWNEDSQTLSLTLEWSSPFPGRGIDRFHLLSPQELLVRSTLETPDGKTASYDTFYEKK